jgi:hypothetical protein
LRFFAGRISSGGIAIIVRRFEWWFKQRDESKLNRQGAIASDKKRCIKQPRRGPAILLRFRAIGRDGGGGARLAMPHS